VSRATQAKRGGGGWVTFFRIGAWSANETRPPKKAWVRKSGPNGSGEGIEGQEDTSRQGPLLKGPQNENQVDLGCWKPQDTKRKTPIFRKGWANHSDIPEGKKKNCV